VGDAVGGALGPPEGAMVGRLVTFIAVAEGCSVGAEVGAEEGPGEVTFPVTTGVGGGDTELFVGVAEGAAVRTADGSVVFGAEVGVCVGLPAEVAFVGAMVVDDRLDGASVVVTGGDDVGATVLGTTVVGTRVGVGAGDAVALNSSDVLKSAGATV